MARVPAIELAPGVVRIPTIGAAATNSFALVDDDGSVTLVDCGVKRAPARIVAGLRAIGRRQLRYSPRPLCTDFRLNEQTAHVLGELEYERVAFTHGTEITDCARDAVRRFLAEVAGA